VISPSKTASQPCPGAIVTPATCWIDPALVTRSVERALRFTYDTKYNHFELLIPGNAFKITIRRSALVRAGGPLSALSIREGGSVGVFVDAAGLILTPDALLLSAVGARAELSAAVGTQWHLHARRLTRHVT
jgi:hypothetical protein